VRYNAGSPRTRHVDDLSRNGPLPGRPAALAGIEILDLHSGQRVVAVIEVVSPSNKCPGPGRDAYLAKQREIMGSTAHLIEIDLLRAGEHVISVPSWLVARRAPYLRGGQLPRADQLRRPLPPTAAARQPSLGPAVVRPGRRNGLMTPPRVDRQVAAGIVQVKNWAKSVHPTVVIVRYGWGLFFGR